LILADLDLLRNINNTYGHLAGDAVLRGVADVFREHLREVDVPARFGGEEFAILLPETTIGDALVIAERVRAAVAETPFHSSTAKTPIWATVSIGVAAFPRDGRESSDLIHQADIAVYRAKLDGRNRVVEAVPDDALVPGQHLALVADAAR
jgi:diguanylate cyclase (GGDEF)-like protein